MKPMRKKVLDLIVVVMKFLQWEWNEDRPNDQSDGGAALFVCSKKDNTEQFWDDQI